MRLLAFAARRVRRTISPASHENTISLRLLKKVILVQWLLGIESLEFHPEAILVDPEADDDTMLGRIDLKVKFAHQHGRYEAYFAVECKRISLQDRGLTRYYVSTGVGKFASGTYGSDHPTGLILGYLLEPPVAPLVLELEGRIAYAHPGATPLTSWNETYSVRAIVEGRVPRRAGAFQMRLLHMLVDIFQTR